MNRQYRFSKDDKLRWWGQGQWVNEPDLINFEYNGYECVVNRNAIQEPYVEKECIAGGYLCGYVRIPETHPYYGIPHNEMDIDCHGGLTFSDGGFIGFDCAHSGDFHPSLEKFKKENLELKKSQEELTARFKTYAHLFETKYRDVEFCIAECKSIVHQLLSHEKCGKSVT